MRYHLTFIFTLYTIIFITRGFCLSMIPMYVEETSVSCLTNGVINHIVKNTDLEENIVSIPSQSLEKKLPHDINRFSISTREFHFYEIKVLFEKQTISTNELVDYRFRYPYVRHLYIGYDINIDDSQIIKNILFVNKQSNIYQYFTDNFKSNIGYYRNKFILNTNIGMINEILKEYNNLETILSRNELKNMITKEHKKFDEALVQIVDKKLYSILENHHRMDAINYFNLNVIYNKEYFIKKQVFNNANHIEFVPEIVPVKLNTAQNISFPKSGIIEQSKYSKNIIRIRDTHLINLLKNLKK